MEDTVATKYLLEILIIHGYVRSALCDIAKYHVTDFSANSELEASVLSINRKDIHFMLSFTEEKSWSNDKNKESPDSLQIPFEDHAVKGKNKL